VGDAEKKEPFRRIANHAHGEQSTTVETTLFEPKRATKRSISDALEELAPYLGEITRVTVST
jgi:hypothetical protein